MKRILSVILVLVMMTAATSTAFAASITPVEPATDSNGVYQIGTAGELVWFANKVNDATIENEDYKISAVLTADIDMTGCEWQPIGKSIVENGTYLAYGYGGMFDGLGHSVTGIDCTVVNENENVYLGFFGRASGATIKNLIAEGSFTGYSNNERAFIGGIVGYADRSVVIENCVFTGSLYGSAGWQVQCGGIAGHLDGSSAKNCFVSASVQCSDESGLKWLGAFAGISNSAAYENCYYNCDVCPGLTGYTDGDLAGVEGKTEEEFNDGTVLNLLNTALETAGSDVRFYQVIGIEPYPVLTDNGHKTTNVTYSVAPTYTVTIPEKVTIDSSTKTTTATIKAENVVVAKGKQIEVALTDTAKTTDNKYFALKTYEGAEITYTVTDSESKTVNVGDTVLAVNPETSSSGSAELTLTAPASVTFAGDYFGTMTFTISLGDVPTA